MWEVICLELDIDKVFKCEINARRYAIELEEQGYTVIFRRY
jgi:hypothetical protein